MAKSVYIVPDASTYVSEEANWYHLYKNRLRKMNEAWVGKSPDEVAPTAAGWLKEQAEALKGYTGKDSV